jgi:sec-independent protein translocase protein TatB
MFNIGGGELLVILLVALLVLGPDKLPEAARKAGNVMSEVRKMSAGFRQEMKSALDETQEVAARDEGQRVSRPPENAKPIGGGGSTAETPATAGGNGSPSPGAETAASGSAAGEEGPAAEPADGAGDESPS